MTVEIIVDGLLDDRWSIWLDELQIVPISTDQTRISGDLPDQAALFGVLVRLHNMGLSLMSFRRIESEGTERDEE